MYIKRVLYSQRATGRGGRDGGWWGLYYDNQNSLFTLYSDVHLISFSASFIKLFYRISFKSCQIKTVK